MSMTPEAEVTTTCIAFAELEGWFCQRNHQGLHSRGKSKGRPDWELTKPFFGMGITIWVEFKSPKGKKSDAQLEYNLRLEREYKCIVITARSFDEFKYDLQKVEKIIRERLAR